MSERRNQPIFAAVLAAGKGTRMKSNRAKVLHTICGVPMVNYAIAALESIEEEEGILLVVNGDGPLISRHTLAGLIERHRSAGVGATVLVAELNDPAGLGRVMEDAGVVRIVEERDATEAEKEIRLVNLGLYAFELKEIRRALV